MEPPQRNYGEGFTVRRRKRQCLHTILYYTAIGMHVYMFHHLPSVCLSMFRGRQRSTPHIMAVLNQLTSKLEPSTTSSTNLHGASRSVCSHRRHSNVMVPRSSYTRSVYEYILSIALRQYK